MKKSLPVVPYFRATNEAILGQFAPQFAASLGEEHHFTPQSDSAFFSPSIDPGLVGRSASAVMCCPFIRHGDATDARRAL